MSREPKCEPNRIEVRLHANWLNNLEWQPTPTNEGYDELNRMKDGALDNLEKAVRDIPKGCEMIYRESLTVECRHCRFYINVANL